jgi:hypothetical protein
LDILLSVLRWNERMVRHNSSMKEDIPRWRKNAAALELKIQRELEATND